MDTSPQTSDPVGMPRTPEGSPPTTEEEESAQFVTSTTGQSSTKELFRNQVQFMCPCSPAQPVSLHCVVMTDPLGVPLCCCVYVDVKGGPAMPEQAPQA